MSDIHNIQNSSEPTSQDQTTQHANDVAIKRWRPANASTDEARLATVARFSGKLINSTGKAFSVEEIEKSAVASTLNNATSDATPNTLVMRDANGGAGFNNFGASDSSGYRADAALTFSSGGKLRITDGGVWHWTDQVVFDVDISAASHFRTSALRSGTTGDELFTAPTKTVARNILSIEPDIFKKLRDAIAMGRSKNPTDAALYPASEVVVTQLSAPLSKVITPTSVADFSNYVTIIGGVLRPTAFQYRCSSVNTINLPSNIDVTNEQATRSSLEFWHDGASVALSPTHIGQSQRFALIVDDQYVTSKNGFASTATDVDHYIKLDFLTRAKRKIKIEHFQGLFKSFSTLGTDSIYPSTRSVNVIVFGDSISEGIGAGATTRWKGWTGEAERLLPNTNWMSASISGTGYVNAGGKWIFAEHIASDMAKRHNDVVVFCGGINDGGSITQASILQCLTLARIAEPDALIIVMGSFVSSGTGAPTVTEITQEGSIASAVTTFADPMCFYMPVSAGVAPWGFGSGRVGATAGNGNYDFFMGGESGTDMTHPNAAGHENIARRFVTALERIIA